ncbi:BTB/POZ domain-containing protein [Colletotrichum karsti]|uniref:BTB/POZ domain-containing protein n=1 Tax=Colletotrichum karsti TaxID=1095194 RepID=A0A9P6HWU7_9PEZI|nr:BTB/POZ domain-containing protein [Colletotrichum karsti]KAF9871565.1 BTB/POZ domain-containing protein [Colletotrichum karsti]
MDSDQNVDVSLIISQYPFIGFRDFRALLRTGDHADCTIVCSGEEIRAHKVLLINHSQYFVKLFASNWKENQENRVEFADVDPAEMKLLLDLFYSGGGTWQYPSRDIAMNVRLWILADRFLVDMAQQIIAAHLNDLLMDNEEKPNASDPEILDMVFSHPVCANSIIGFIFSEAACFVDQYLYSDRVYSDKIRALQSKHSMLGQTMYEWCKIYASCASEIESDDENVPDTRLVRQRTLDARLFGPHGRYPEETTIMEGLIESMGHQTSPVVMGKLRRLPKCF